MQIDFTPWTSSVLQGRAVRSWWHAFQESLWLKWGWWREEGGWTQPCQWYPCYSLHLSSIDNLPSKTNKHFCVGIEQQGLKCKWYQCKVFMFNGTTRFSSITSLAWADFVNGRDKKINKYCYSEQRMVGQQHQNNMYFLSNIPTWYFKIIHQFKRIRRYKNVSFSI